MGVGISQVRHIKTPVSDLLRSLRFLLRRATAGAVKEPRPVTRDGALQARL